MIKYKVLKPLYSKFYIFVVLTLFLGEPLASQIAVGLPGMANIKGLQDAKQKQEIN